MAKRATVVSVTAVPLNHSVSAPLYRQIYKRLQTAILMGQLLPGTRLPSTREMATELEVSRNTVMNAFEQLLAEGYLEGYVGSGTFVSRSLPDDLLQARANRKRTSSVLPKERRLSRRGKVLATHFAMLTRPVRKSPPFTLGIPALDEFPVAVWSRLVSRQWRKLPRNLLDYGDSAGYKPLRKAIAAYLGPSRGVRCEPEQIIIVSGTQQAFDLAARVLLDPNDVAFTEEYSYVAANAALIGGGARLVPVPVDEEGLNISAKVVQGEDARIVFVTPSHQYPLGVTMSLARRLALLDWANRSKAWILEDDYDGEYVGRNVDALQGLDKNGRVIYLGTFSKVLFPSLRIGYMVVPPDLVAGFAAARAMVGWCSPTVDQAVLTDFIADGHFARHIKRMRPLYVERQAALVNAARVELQRLLEFRPGGTGIHLMGWLPDEIDDQAATRAAVACGVAVQPLSSFTVKGNRSLRNGLVLGCGAYSVPRIRAAVSKLVAALQAVRRAVRDQKSKSAHQAGITAT